MCAAALPLSAAAASPPGQGGQLWLSRYNGPPGLNDGGRAVAVSPDGSRLFVAGESQGDDFYASNMTTVAYEASAGKQLWVDRYSRPSGDFARAAAIVVSPDGTRV